MPVHQSSRSRAINDLDQQLEAHRKLLLDMRAVGQDDSMAIALLREYEMLRNKLAPRFAKRRRPVSEHGLSAEEAPEAPRPGS